MKHTKHTTLILCAVLSVCLCAFFSVAHASEVTGQLSSGGVSTTTSTGGNNGGGGSGGSSEVTGTFGGGQTGNDSSSGGQTGGGGGNSSGSLSGTVVGGQNPGTPSGGTSSGGGGGNGPTVQSSGSALGSGGGSGAGSNQSASFVSSPNTPSSAVSPDSLNQFAFGGTPAEGNPADALALNSTQNSPNQNANLAAVGSIAGLPTWLLWAVGAILVVLLLGIYAYGEYRKRYRRNF